MHRKLNRFCFAALILLAFPVLAQEQDPGADLAMGRCDALAQIHETLICREDIELSSQTFADMKAEYEASGVDPQQALDIRRLERVGNALWDAALVNAFGKDALVPAPEDIKAYSAAHKAALDQNYESDQQTLEEVNTILQTQQDLSQAQKASIRQLKATLLTSIRFYEQRAEQRAELPPEFLNMMAETEYEMAEGFLRQWTIARLLYNKYGGNVVKISGRLEPVDAYIEFLDKIEQQDSFKIYDPAYDNALNIMRSRWREMAEGETVETDKARSYFSSPLSQFKD